MIAIIVSLLFLSDVTFNLTMCSSYLVLDKGRKERGRGICSK